MNLARGRFRVACRVVVVVAATVGLPATGHAALLDLGNITRDTASGLDWLDLTESTSRSFVDVSGQFGAGGDYEGFRYGTRAEVETFWTHAGIPDIFAGLPAPNDGFTALNFDPVGALIGLVGVTDLGPGGGLAAIGQTADTEPPFDPDHFAPFLHQCLSPSERECEFFDTARAMTSELLVVPEFAFPEIGHWLVKSVPEPATLALLGLGLAGLGWSQRKAAH